MDQKGAKAARHYISMIKVAAPRVALKVVDEAIQIHGVHGVKCGHVPGQLRETTRVQTPHK